MEESKDNHNEICTKREFQKFCSIHKRFKLLMTIHEYAGTVLIEAEAGLAEDIWAFWPTIVRISQKLKIPLNSNLESVEVVVYGEEVNDLEKKRRWLRRDLERIMIHLKKHFFVKEVVFTGPEFAQDVLNTMPEYVKPPKEIKPVKKVGTKTNNKMLRPTVEDITEIIKKLRTLKEKQADFINEKHKAPVDKPVDTPFDELSVDELIEKFGDAGVGYKGLSIEGLLGAVVRAAVRGEGIPPEFTAKLGEVPSQEEIKGGVEVFFKNRIPAFPASVLQELLDQVILKFYTGDEIPITDAKSRLTEEGKRLNGLRDAISRELKLKNDFAKSIPKLIKMIKQLNVFEQHKIRPKKDWPDDIQSLINEIDKLLCPYWDYLEEYGPWSREERSHIVFIIKTGNICSLDKVIDVVHELEKIKYKMEIESQQVPPDEPTETGQPIKPVKDPPKKRGRSKKYTVQQAKQVRASYDEYYKKLKDSKHAWNRAAKDHGIKSGKAAEMACRRYLKQNK